MCRLGFISSTKPDLYYSDLVERASMIYSERNNDGFGMVYHDTHTNIVKVPTSAKGYWSTATPLPDCDAIIFHNRLKSSGELNVISTHPFVSADEKYSLVHNGCLFTYEKAQKKLEEKCKFVSEVDSEILLHAFVEYKVGFIKFLKKQGVTGYATLIVYEKNEDDSKPPTIWVYTDNAAMVFYKQNGSIAGFSDGEILGYAYGESAKQDTLYRIEGGQITYQKYIGHIEEHSFTYEFDYSKLYMQTGLKEAKQEPVLNLNDVPDGYDHDGRPVDSNGKPIPDRDLLYYMNHNDTTW